MSRLKNISSPTRTNVESLEDLKPDGVTLEYVNYPTDKKREVRKAAIEQGI